MLVSALWSWSKPRWEAWEWNYFMKFVECKSYPCKIYVSDPVYTKGIYSYGLFLVCFRYFQWFFHWSLIQLSRTNMWDAQWNIQLLSYQLIVGVAFIQSLIVILTLSNHQVSLNKQFMVASLGARPNTLVPPSQICKGNPTMLKVITQLAKGGSKVDDIKWVYNT